jgi:hypothetical protein
MKGISRTLSSLGLAALSLGFLAVTVPLASAHEVYPPGWNKPTPNLAAPSNDFRAGWGWDDYQRYWPDQTIPGAAKSRPMAYGPIIYQMEPQGHRYHRVQ